MSAGVFGDILETIFCYPLTSYNAIATINGFIFPAKRLLPDIYCDGHRLRELNLFSWSLNLDFTLEMHWMDLH